MIVKHSSSLKGEVTIPGDKSISHRSIMLGSLANGTTRVTNFLEGADCLATIRCFSKMGILIEQEKDTVLIHGKGLHGLQTPKGSDLLDAGNSGTTTRLLSGILCGQKFSTTLSGDESLITRPMGRIMEPLRMMGADIKSLNGDQKAPLLINHTASVFPSLQGIHYNSPVSSAQVKSSILLAGLYAEGETSVTEPVLSRNHTELMLKGYGGCISSKKEKDGRVTAILQPGHPLESLDLNIPGDISSAAYFIAAALLVPGSEVLVKNVGINPTRDGFLKICEKMGAKLEYQNVREDAGEPSADILVRHQSLKGTTIEGEVIPTLIDEIPVLAVMAAFADGTTIIRDAAELKVKETDRIMTTTAALRAMGVDVTPTDDGMIIHGGQPLHGATIDSFLDHRIAMAFSVAALAADGSTTIQGSECVHISYPEFYATLSSLQ